MVSSKDGDSVFMPDFESDQQGYCFNAVMALIMIGIPLST